MDLLRGTLDTLILQALEAGPVHGYGIADWIRRVTDEALQVEDGALYASLHRLRDRGYLAAEWGVSDKGRRAKFYRLTPSGREELTRSQAHWARYAKAVEKVFRAGGAAGTAAAAGAAGGAGSGGATGAGPTGGATGAAPIGGRTGAAPTGDPAASGPAGPPGNPTGDAAP